MTAHIHSTQFFRIWKVMGCEGWREGHLYLSREPDWGTQGEKEDSVSSITGTPRKAPVMLSKPRHGKAANPRPVGPRLLSAA